MRNDNLVLALASVALLTFATAIPTQTATAQGVTIELHDAVVDPGGMTSIDVSISPTMGSQTLNSFEIPFLITADPGSISSLQFADPHDESFLTDAAREYVFFGTSDAVDTMMPVNETRSINNPNDYVFAFDLTLNLSDLTLTEPRLLTQLQFTNVVPPGTGPLAVIGDSFTVAVNDAVDPLAIDNLNGDFIEVTVAGPASVTVVPEPGSFALCAAVSSCIALRRRRRR